MSFLGSSLEVHEIKMRLVSVAVFLPSCFFFFSCVGSEAVSRTLDLIKIRCFAK